MGLYRKREGAVIGGVCIGMADKYGIDPLLIRIAALVIICFNSGLIAVIYLILWAVLPAEDIDATIKEELFDKIQKINIGINSVSKSFFLGGLFIVLGIFALISFISPFDIICRIFIPLIFIGIGIYLLITYRKK